MLIDSGYERITFQILIEKQQEYCGQFQIEKPLHDIGAAQPGDDDQISDQDRRLLEKNGAPPVVKPDFILHFPGRSAIVVETMGFKYDWYRDRKRSTKTEMLRALKTNDYCEHDFHRPTGTQELRNDLFREHLNSILLS